MLVPTFRNKMAGITSKLLRICRRLMLLYLLLDEEFDSEINLKRFSWQWTK